MSPTWCACLVPSVFSVADVYEACQPAGELHQLLVPQGSHEQRWMGPRHTRTATVGLFVPVWWDARLQPEEGHDDLSLMQRGGGRECSRSPRRAEDTTPFSTQSSSTQLLAHVFRLSREHRVLSLDRASFQTLSEQVRLSWAAPARHGYTDLHIVSWPPADLESTADETDIVEYAVDRQRQADPADRLIIVDVKIQADNPTVAGSHLRRVLWCRGFMMREDMLHLLASAGLCKLTTIQCTLKVNHNPWPHGDGVRRQMMHGDFVQLDVVGPDGVPSSHIQVALCEQESS